ncbi:uncharacterized protein METZ01_LOCUS433395, partial [marine metagenome]
FKSVTTQLFIDGDPYLESDAVFAVKGSLVAKIVSRDGASSKEIASDNMSPMHNDIHFDFRLEPAQ